MVGGGGLFPSKKGMFAFSWSFVPFIFKFNDRYMMNNSYKCFIQAVCKVFPQLITGGGLGTMKRKARAMPLGPVTLCFILKTPIIKERVVGGGRMFTSDRLTGREG